MTTISEIVKETLKEKSGKSADQISKELNKRLSDSGLEAPLAIEEIDRKTRINPACDNYGNIEATIQYRVNHGDGTYSDPWWTDWKCL